MCDEGKRYMWRILAETWIPHVGTINKLSKLEQGAFGKQQQQQQQPRERVAWPFLAF